MKRWTLVLCLPLAAAACSKSQYTVAKSQPFVTTTRTVTRTETTPGKNLELTKLEVNPEIAKLCALPEAHFPFDSSEITGDAKAALDKLADCFTQGALAGRNMKIIGHADPRGTQEYNIGLGQRRASAVADYLKQRGMATGQMETASMGEIEATGTNEQGWANDRKVEILLGKEAVVLPSEEEQKLMTH